MLLAMHAVAVGSAAMVPVSEADIETEQAVEDSVRGWARVWSELDIEAYLGYYADDFKPARGTRIKWEEARRKRFKKTGSVSVKINDLQIFTNKSKNKAVANFTQAYKSATYTDKVQKILVLVKTDDGWKITHEHSPD